MSSRKTLSAFLAAAKAALAAPPAKRPKPLIFVVGNESADLDSLCSALLLAYFRSQAPYLPSIPRADLELRPEFVAALAAASTTPDDVVTLDELPPPPPSQGGEEKKNAAAAPLPPDDTAWLLVDHNQLTGALAAAYAHRVVGCVDHHADEGAVPRGAETRVLEQTGSCASLVVEQCRDTWDALPRDAAVDAGLARLALAPILMDTSNLTSASKTTPRDERAVAYAEARLAADKFDRAAYFADLTRLKTDLGGMSMQAVLRKDYKQWREGGIELGTASVPQGFAYLVDKAGGAAALVRELDAWVARRGIDLGVVLTAFTTTTTPRKPEPEPEPEGEGEDRGDSDSPSSVVFARELLICATTEEAARAARAFVEAEADDLQLRGPWRDGALNLDPDDDDDEEKRKEEVPPPRRGTAMTTTTTTTTTRWRRCWTQGALAHSRKQIAPKLREAMRKAATAQS
ncbi:exopolyphosphatase [Xylariaceae sp. FL0804]|nr:exopolyphosphatase [Xylariaceae sp. FL0804]